MPSIFTRIIRGEIPCHRLFENELVIAFLDVNPLSPGHALVVPKQEMAELHMLQEVMHVHFHIIPKYQDGRGLALTWKPCAIDHTAAAELAARVQRQLGA